MNNISLLNKNYFRTKQIGKASLSLNAGKGPVSGGLNKINETF